MVLFDEVYVSKVVLLSFSTVPTMTPVNPKLPPEWFRKRFEPPAASVGYHLEIVLEKLIEK